MRRLLFLAGFVFVFAATLALLGHSYGAVALLAMFAILAMVGILAVFGFALGFLRIGPRELGADIAREALNSLPTGMLVTDRKGRIVYANRAYGEETGAAGPASVRSLERLLSREAEASEAIYRLANLARENKPAKRNSA